MSDEAKIKPCKPCKDTQAAKFQDQEYGKGMRVHNPMKKGGHRCSVCGAVSN